MKLEQQEELLEQNEAAEAELREQISTMEDSWQQRQRELRDANKRYSELRAKVGSQQAKLEQTRQQRYSYQLLLDPYYRYHRFLDKILQGIGMER